MRKSRFSESQIAWTLKEAENGRQVKDLCREHGISSACFSQWKSKSGELEASDLRRLKELEAENNRLKKMYADMALEDRAIKDLLENSKAVGPALGGRVSDPGLGTID